MSYKEEVYQNYVRNLGEVLKNKVGGKELSKLIFLCIGTDRIIGDSFGPLAGYRLKKLFYNNDNIEVIGDLENTVNLYNVKEIIENIYNTYETPFIIAIDSAVSNKTEIGNIIVSNSKMNVAGIFSNRKIYVGDISIKGVVSKDLKNRECNFRHLQNVPLSLIINMTDILVQGINNVINV